jgi:hypothetical protein
LPNAASLGVAPLLTIESEDCLLRLLLELELELGFDRFEFLGWIEISLFFQKMAVRFFWTTSAWRRFLRTFGRQLFLI